jgi:outer membrane receptor for ferric coprogen and ferric-rhodotorulic acid
MTSLTEVMASSPGISAQNYDTERYTFMSRGFSIDNYQYDGIPTAFVAGYSAGESSIDPIIYDRVEVVRGATGLLTGAGNPAASINLIRKRADSKTLKAQFSASAGTWEISSPLSSEGSVRGRIVAAYQQRHSFLNHYSNTKRLFFGTLQADISHNTTLRLGYNDQQNIPRGSTWGGFPLWYADGGRTDWSRSLSTAARWSSWGTHTRGAFAGLEHRFANDWRLDALLSYSKHEMDAHLLYLSGQPDRHTGLGMNASPAYYFGDRIQKSVDVKASGPFVLFGREHELIMGLSRSKQTSDFKHRSPIDPAPVGNFFAWDGSYPEPAWNPAPTSTLYQRIYQNGTYAAVRFSLAEPLKLIIGGRYSQWKNEIGGRDARSFSQNAFTPYVGLLYDLNDNLTAYASYTSIFKPQDLQDRSGGWLAPLEGHSYEAGIKGEYLEGRLNASAAVFQINQNNVGQMDEGHRVPGTTKQAYFAAQGTRSRGYDLELKGQLAHGWNIAAGLTHWTGRDQHGDAIQTGQPRTLLRLFTTYRLSGAWHRLTVGGGVNWQSESYMIVSGPRGKEKVAQPAYALVELMSRYQFNRQLSLQVNAKNIFNKKYYDQIGFFKQGSWGAPPNIMATASYKY